MGSAIHPSNLDDVTIKLCPAGSYCKQTPVLPDTETENLCQINYYNPIQGQSACLPCPGGFSCQERGLVIPDPCPTGSYCPPFVASSGVANVVPCPAGTYSFDKYLKDVS
jgi:Tyrosine-protein kinase ephrin type A/B receptor-like